MGQGLLRRCRLPQDRPARTGHALGGRALCRGGGPGARGAARPLAHPARRRRDLRIDPRRGDDRRLPDREPRPDADAAPHPAAHAGRPDRAGRAGPSRPDPGRRRPSLYREAQAPARGPRLRGPLRAPAAGAGAARHAGHDRLPGAGDRGGDGAGGLQLGRGGGAAAGDEPQALRGGDRGAPRPLPRRRGGGERGSAGDGGAGLGADPGLLRLRLPQGPLGRLRPARLPVGLAADPLRAGVPLRAAQRAADGLLPARRAGPRGATPRRPPCAAGRQPQPRSLPRRDSDGRNAGRARGPDRPWLREGSARGGDGSSGRRAHPRRSLPERRRSCLALKYAPRRSRAPRLGRRPRRPGEVRQSRVRAPRTGGYSK